MSIIKKKFKDVFSYQWFSIIIRNQRIPILSVYIYNKNDNKYVELSSQNVGFISINMPQENKLKLKIITYDLKEHLDIIHLNQYFDDYTIDGYNGGMIIPGNIQV